MGYLIGGALALGTGVFGTVVGLDRSRAFYPMLLMVIATYYALFAVMASSPSALWPELLVFAGFAAVAVTGFKSSLWLVVGGLLAHGAFDAVHSWLFVNPGVPPWWPAFCAAFDIAAAGYLAVQILSRHQRQPASARPTADWF